MQTRCQIKLLCAFYELALASTAVPLSLVSFLASSVFFAAAICHAGMAARPVGILLLYEAEGVARPLAWLSAPEVPFACSAGAGVDGAWGVGVETEDVPFTLGVWGALGC